MSKTASERQMAFIRTLMSERMDNAEAAFEALVAQRITSEGASKVIDALKKMPPLTTAAPAATPGNRGALPFNRYSGRCVLCGQQVEAQQGTYRKGTTRAWETLHLPGECPAPAADKPVVGATFSDQVQEIVANIPDGRYAVPSVTGTNDLTFFKVATGRTSQRRYVRHIVGGHEDTGRLTLDWIRNAVSSVEALGAAESMALFGRETTTCGRCGIHLTDEISRKIGLGPDCRKAFGI